MAYNAALYCRISKDDDAKTESASITTQKEMLKRYAMEQGFNIYDFYIDDGYSGTNFDRPDFIRMKKDIESGKINVVITKDLSRLGRNYIVSGELLEEYFPKNRVRCIAISDGYDSDNEYNDIAPFKNVINELYAKDISKKIKSAFITKMKNGKYIGNFAPYGYLKSPSDKNALIINPETAPIVREIFKMAAQGKRPVDIARILNERKIPSPAVYKCKINPHLELDNYTKRREWTGSNIQKMLKNIVYIGNTAQHKTSKISFKSNTTILNDRKDWIIVENTHEPIIDKHTFELVGKILKSRRNAPKSDFKNIFSGIAKCGDCGSNMSLTGTRKKGSKYNLVCGKYKLYGSKECTNHFIDYDDLYKIVLDKINLYLKLTHEQKSKILTELAANDAKPARIKIERQIQKLEGRKNDILKILKGFYEDKYLGKVSEDFFNDRVSEYEAELNGINTELNSLKNAEETAITDNYKQFADMLDGISEIKELNTEIIHALIDTIIIHDNTYETDAASVKHRIHHIQIYFKFKGQLA